MVHARRAEDKGNFFQATGRYLGNGEELPEAMRQAVALEGKYANSELFRLFGRKAFRDERDFLQRVELNDIRLYIRPHIEKLVARILDTLVDFGCPLYMQDSRWDNFYAEDRLALRPVEVRPVLCFERTGEYTRYVLKLQAGERSFYPADYTLKLLSRRPCRALAGQQLFRFPDDFDGRRLQPFLQKREVMIPKANEQLYFQKFILKTVRHEEIEVQGFDVVLLEVKKALELSLERDVLGMPVLAALFLYGKRRLPAWSAMKSLVELRTQGEGYAFYKVNRDTAWEQGRLAVLAALGLEECRTGTFRVAPATEPANGVPQEAEIREAGKEREWREYQLSELSGARLAPGEIEELENEQKELAHSEETRELLASALSRFSCGDYSFVQELKESIRDLSKVSSHIPRFSEMCDRLESCRIELQDIEDGLAVEADSVKVSPERLEEVESRLSFLWGLMKKHGVSTVEELIERKESFEAALARDESAQSLLDSAVSERDALKASLDELSAVLHERRISAARELSPLLQQSVRSLEIPQAVFNIVVSVSPERRSTGDDEVDFMFSSSASMAPGDVSKTASGGELSRIMLCIKALLAKYGAMATLVFDEIDTGVSGRAADRMGAMLSGMGKNIQILAITHLPQVAAKGDFHFCVRKEASEGGKTVTTVSRLDGEDKIREIARLLSGSTVGDAAIKNAEELLCEASSAK